MIERFRGCIQHRVTTYKSHRLCASFALPAFVVVVLAPLFFFIPSSSHAAVLIQRPLYVGLTTGLVGNWTFDGPTVFGTSVTDVSGQGNHGTFREGPALSSGRIGQGVLFPGSSSTANDGPEIVISDALCGSIVNIPSTDEWTVTAWIYRNGLSVTGEEGIYMSGDMAGSDKSGVQIYILSNNFRAEAVVGANSKELVSSGTVLALKKWYHLTAIKSGTDVSLYIDGIFDTSGTLSSATMDYTCSGDTPETDIGVMEDSSTNSNYFNGLIDDVRIYNRALSSQEIKRLYTIGAGNKIASIPMGEGLVGYWDFDRINGTTVYDRSDNLNHGTMTNMEPLEDQVNSKAGLGQALDFDGTNDYAVIANETNFDFDRTDPFSVAVWLKPNVSDTGVQLPVTKGRDEAPYIGWHFVTNLSASVSSDPGKVTLMLINSISGPCGGKLIVRSTTNDTNINNGSWNHYTITYDGSSSANGIAIYENGAVLPMTTGCDILGTNSILNDYPVAIGARSNGSPTNNEYYNGKMDDMRIYNYALSADEVRRLYNITQPTISSVQLDDGLVGYWSFDRLNGSTVPDLSSNSNDGTMTNMEPLEDRVNSGSAALGQALEFDGVNDKVSTPSNPSLEGFSAFTLASWIYLEGASDTDGGRIIHKAQGSTGDDYHIGTTRAGAGVGTNCATSDRVMMRVNTNNGVTTFCHPTNLIQNTWYHVTGVWNGSIMTIYLNGANPQSTSRTGTLDDSNDSLGIGGHGSDTGETRNFNGRLDDVRIYNRALSDTEIRRLYNEGNMH